MLEGKVTLEEETVSSLYSRLFSLPGTFRAVVLGFVLSLFSSALLVSLFFPLHASLLNQTTMLEVILSGLVIFFGAFVISSGLSCIVFRRRKSKIMSLRRTLGVSLFSLVFTDAVLLIGWIVGYVLSLSLLLSSWVLGLAAGFTVRLLVNLVIVDGHAMASFLDSFGQPLLESLPFVVLYPMALSLDFLLLVMLTVIVFGTSATAYVRVVGRQLKRSTSIDGRVFLRSFLTEWSAGVGEELEKAIDKNSVTRDLEVAALSFKNKKGKTKCILLIPSIHPGPFRGVGSSSLPSFLMQRLEKDFGCPVLCAHGPSTHGENLVRSSQCQDIYERTLDILKRCHSYPSSGPIVRLSEDGMSVSCQIFGDYALLVSASSPSLPTDDISLEVGESAVAAAQKSIKKAFFIDSHSCIDPESDYVLPGSAISKLLAKLSQRTVINASELDQRPFMVGASKFRSTGMSRVEGMGEEGLSSLVIQVADRRYVYLLLDSNNLVVNLREQIVKGLKDAGFDDVEVLTSDTHTTSALRPGKMGYNPLGFLTPHDKIVKAAIQVTNSAVENLEHASVCIGSQLIKGLKVAGEENMKSILSGVRNSLKAAKRLAPICFGLATLLSTILVLLIAL
jgi:putative membrane protein